MYWLSSVITTIPVRIWRLVPNQLVRPFGRTYRWDFRFYFSSHCHVPIPYCHHSRSGLYILVMYARLKVPSYRTSWFVNTALGVPPVAATYLLHFSALVCLRGFEPRTTWFGAWDEIWTHADDASVSLSSRSPTELLKQKSCALPTELQAHIYFLYLS